MESLLVESAARGTLVAAAIAAVLGVTRIQAPAVLHAVWTGVVLAMLAMPLWSLWGPKAAVEMLPSQPTPTVVATPPATLSSPTSPANVEVVPSRSERAAAAPHVSWTWRDIALGVYASVALVLLMRLALGTLTGYQIRRRSYLQAGQLTSAACASPITVGWLRPVVILPQQWEEWSHAQLDAVLTHEGAHVRRRDPLVQWFALLNRALFWFDPVAWWLERRLSALAEQNCDDAVLARGHDPQDYSEYLLEIARAVGRGARLNLAGVFMPGVFLPQRIRRILDRAPTAHVSYTRVTCAVAACVIATVFSAVATPVRAASQQSVAVSRMVIRPLQPRWIPPESTVPQPVSLEWMDGDEWAFEVQPIITFGELREYSQLRAAADRDGFIARFWARRDPSPGTPDNEFRDEFSRRVQFAREHLADPQSAGTPGFDTDRGRVYLMFGPPDAIDTRAGAIPQEVWRYVTVAGIGREFSVRFLRDHRAYCAYRIVSPAPIARLEGVGSSPAGEPVQHTSVQLYPLGLTAMTIPVDATRVVGARWELRNRNGVQVDEGQLGFLDDRPAADPLARHLPAGFLDSGLGCTHALPADTYTLTTAVRFTTGQFQRESLTFAVQ